MIAAIYCRAASATETASISWGHRSLWVLRRWFIVIAFFAAVSIVTINLGFGFDWNRNAFVEVFAERPIFQKTPGDPNRRQSATSVAGALRPGLGSNQVRRTNGASLEKHLHGRERSSESSMTGRFVGSQDITFTRPSSRCRLRRKLYFWWRCSDTSQDVASRRREDFAGRRFFC